MPDKTAADLLREVGPLLSGGDVDYLDDLAGVLGVKRDTLRNIVRGSMTGPAVGRIVAELLPYAERRAVETAAARDAIAAWVRQQQAAPAPAVMAQPKRKARRTS